MRPIWIMAGLAGVIAAPAFAQTKIPPSHVYSSEPPAGLDKDYGMPQSPMPGPDPSQKAKAAKPQKESELFTGLSTVARPETQPSDVPNFFQASPGVASSDPQTSDVPNFFQATPDSDLPKVAKAQSAYSTMDTPLFTSTNEFRRAATQRPVIPCQAMRRRRMGQGRADTGAGEGNRTLVCSLGSCRSTIELHPRRRPFRRFSPRMQLGPRLPQGANPMRPGRTACAISGSGPTGPRCQRAQGG